jgi:starch phosphorylase
MSLTAPFPTVAYFSMEVGLESAIPTYSGGLGILAGDNLRAAADLGLPVVAVTLLHRQGYFRQRLDARGNQSEEPAPWEPGAHLEPVQARVAVSLEGRPVQLRAWRYQVQGINGHRVPVYFLDAALEENTPWDRSLTDHLYGGDQRYRLCQEAILGLGGLAMLEALGHDDVRIYHMNEGHSALLTLGLLREQGAGQLEQATEQVRRRCVFTTHTPVPAGHDQFPTELVRQVLGEGLSRSIADSRCCLNDTLNMTYLGLHFSHYVNGVAMRHGEISRGMFPGYPVNSITNGVHAVTWTSPPFQKLYDQHMPEWRRDNHYLRYAVGILPSEVHQAHAEAKQDLLAEVHRRNGVRLDSHVLTLGFARRATSYKRADLLFSDLDRLRRIAREVGPVQVLYGGKAHPRDEGGKMAIRKVFEAAAALTGEVAVVYLEEYDMALARLLCSGVDVWLNTPQKPQEASGTSGMKAALNGVPSLSVLDGWWVEGHLEGVTGWSVGEEAHIPSDPAREASSLYSKLEYVILPLFYSRPLAFAQLMRSTVALNGSFFNAQRMMYQYVHNAYLPQGKEEPLPILSV